MGNSRYCDRCTVKPARKSLPAFVVNALQMHPGTRVCTACATELTQEARVYA